jgi:hypothetical protein
MFCIQQAPGLFLGPETCCPTFHGFLSPSRKMLGLYLRIDHCYLQIKDKVNPNRKIVVNLAIPRKEQ